LASNSFVADILQPVRQLIGSFFFAISFGGGPGDIQKGEQDAIRELLPHLQSPDGRFHNIVFCLWLKDCHLHKQIFRADHVANVLGIRGKSPGQDTSFVRMALCAQPSPRRASRGRSLKR
jgi:hypothetical protein